MEFINKLASIGYNGDERLLNLYSSYALEAYLKCKQVQPNEVLVHEYKDWVVHADENTLRLLVQKNTFLDEEMVRLLSSVELPAQIYAQIQNLGFVRLVSVGSMGILADFLLEVRHVAPTEYAAILTGENVHAIVNNLIMFYTKFKSVEVNG